MTDYDGPWKEMLDNYLPAFFAFFFPEIFADIDWSRAPEALENELRQVVQDAELGQRRVDKLFKVWTRDGVETWLLVHIEVQSQRDPEFPKRMFTYNYRIFDRYNLPVVSLAILADEELNWRPTSFTQGRWGCSSGIQFLPRKLLDWASREAELEADPNPFATMVLAHLKTQATHGDAPERQRWKMRVIRSLYERGMDRSDIAKLFHTIDWLMDLPIAAARSFWQELTQLEQERAMPYVTTGERIGFERGERATYLKTLKTLLQILFGDAGVQLFPLLEAVEDVEKLEKVHQALASQASLEEVQRLLS